MKNIIRSKNSAVPSFAHTMENISENAEKSMPEEQNSLLDTKDNNSDLLIWKIEESEPQLNNEEVKAKDQNEDFKQKIKSQKLESLHDYARIF